MRLRFRLSVLSGVTNAYFVLTDKWLSLMLAGKNTIYKTSIMKRNLFSAGLLLLMAGCTKDKGNTDTTVPIITVTSPTNNQVFSGGQTVNITAAISDDSNIEEVHLEITNTTTGAFITHEHFVPGASTYALARTFTVQAGSAYRIKIEADDAHGNKTEAQVTISAN